MSEQIPQVPGALGPGYDVVTFTVKGTTAAADRLAAVSWHDPDLAYAAAGETLWWITTLDAMLKRFLGGVYPERRRTENVVGRQLEAIRYARGRFTHAFDVLEVVEPGPGADEQGYGTPGYWKWRPLPPDRRSGEDAGRLEYEALLAGKLVTATLTNVLTFLRAQACALGGATVNPTATR